MSEHDGCVGCRYEKDEQESKNCIGCKQNAIDKYTRMTNADKIRSMSDEELAEFLSETHDEKIGKFLGDIAICDNNVKSIYEWLQSEVSE